MNAGLAMAIGFALGVLMMGGSVVLMLGLCKVSAATTHGLESDHGRGDAQEPR